MKSGSPEKQSRQELLARVAQLERQLESQRDLQALIESLQIHQEEVHHQQTALIDAQSELEASRDRYAELYDFAPVPILTLRSNGIIEMLNLAAARLLAIDRVNAIGTPFLVLLMPESRRPLLDHLSRCRRESGLVRSELILRSRTGNEVPIEIQSRWFEVGGREPVLQSVLIDLGPQLERARIQREEASLRARDEAKDRFLAVLSHELRTPLTPILLTVEVLEATSGKDPALQPGLAMIRRNTELQARLIDDLLDVTRIGRGKLHLQLSPVSIGETLRHVAELCEGEFDQAGVALELRLNGAHYVSGDPTRLRQIFWNLLKNAVQHTPRGGRVSLAIEASGDHAIRVLVSDNGDGIDPAEQERLFERFGQSARDGQARAGLGLGLAICRGLVERHGGSIRVDSPGLERGATFTVELPTCPPPSMKAEPRGAPAGGGHHRIRILLVEDHQDTAAAMRTVLGNLGFDVLLAGTLDEGRRLARAPFDILVSDLRLPDGSGLDLMRELSAAGPVKGIAISGFGSEKDVSQSRDAGFDCHLVKPVAIERVVDAIHSLVSESAGQTG